MDWQQKNSSELNQTMEMKKGLRRQEREQELCFVNVF